MTTTTANNRLVWLDRLKAIALVWIFFNHATEKIFGEPNWGNPSGDWPVLSDRIAQLHPLSGYGVWNLPVNLFRYVGWLGDEGVSLFLILSGFGLVWGILARSERGPQAGRLNGVSLPTIDAKEFYHRRMNRIYPLWIAAHLCLLPMAIFGWKISLIDSAYYFSMLGVRVLRGQLYFAVPAWWFIALLLQLYLLFPLLWWLLRKCGVWVFVIVVCTVALVIRGVGLAYFDGYLDAWSRGAIFITRLPEFVVGMGAAVWMWQGKSFSRPVGILLGLILFGLGTALSLTLGGMTVSPLMQGVGAFFVLHAVMIGGSQRQGVLDWIGKHSFSLYLVHQPLLDAAMKHGRPAVAIVVAVVMTVIAAIALEKVTEFAVDRLARWREKKIAWRFAAAAILVWIALIAAELVVRHVNPQETSDLGWGERASLEPSGEFGWNLKPGQQTHLRWESYDYHVTANSLGYPGPQYSEQKPAGVYRILVVGDAFSSAEGVDTDQAWPRLLEKRLAGSQVMNFAITGYGPNQYLAVVKEFAPRYRPDLILIGLFINDYGDVLMSDDDFRESIGFGLPDPDGLAGILSFRQLAAWVRSTAIRNIYQRALHKPDPTGYFLGQFHFLERDCPDVTGAGRVLLADRIGKIKMLADRLGAKVKIVMIPSGPQVCGADQLAYWPKFVDLSDTQRFDVDLPQRVTGEIAQSLSIPCYDLRPVLKAAKDTCPYQARNMHWTAAGHQATADYLAGVLELDAGGGK